jgi:hypothetical protein
MTWAAIGISAGLAAAGAGTEAYANHQALTKQDQVAAAGIQAQQRLKQQAQQTIAPTIKSAQNNQQNVQANQTSLDSQYAAALNRASPVQSTVGALPGASKAYAQSVADAQAQNRTFGTNYANLTAAAGAPVLTNQQTQEQLGGAATQLGGIQQQSANQNQLTQMQVQAITANPWLLALGSALGGASKGYGSYAGYKGPSSVASNVSPNNGYGAVMDAGLGE